MLTNWKARALAAEAIVAQADAAIAEAQNRLAAVDAIHADRAALLGIVTDPAARVNRFTFVRNGSLYVIETYSAMEDDVPGWRRALLDPLPPVVQP